MKLHITGIHAQSAFSTAQVAQQMVCDIAHNLGFNEVGIYSYGDQGESYENRRIRFDGMIAGMEKGDTVVFQTPTWHNLAWERQLLEHIKLYGGRIIMFVHDVESLMIESSAFLLDILISLYNEAEVLIVPTLNMKNYLLEHGVRNDMKFVIQEIWDYTIGGTLYGEPKFEKVIHFAGNIEKFQFPNNWEYPILLKVYSNGEISADNVQTMGFLPSGLLSQELRKGGFGLLWYGSDYWYQYMHYNCSFKLSAYLAAGIPVIVPRGIGNQELIEKNHLGIVVDSIEEAIEIINSMTEEDYMGYIKKIADFSILLREGYFTKKLLIESIHKLLRE